MIYAIGAPGQPVRQFLDTSMVTQVAANVAAGEVGVPVAAVPATSDARLAISSDGTMVEAITISIEARRRARWREAKAYRDRMVQGGCETPLGRIQTDEASQTNIIGAMIMAQGAQAAGLPFTVEWRMTDNNLVQHDADAVIAMALAVGAHKAACFAASFSIADAIDASAEPDTVDLGAGYPAVPSF